MSNQTPEVTNDTAVTVADALKLLESGDVVNYQSGLPSQTVHSVNIEGNAVWVHFDDPESLCGDNHSIGALFVATEAESELYDAPQATMLSTERHNEPELGTITQASPREFPDDESKSHLVIDIDWTLNPDVKTADDDDKETDARSGGNTEDIRGDVEWDAEQLSLPSITPPLMYDNGTSPNPNFFLSAHTDGSVSIYPPGSQDPVGRIDVSQLADPLAAQVNEIIDREVRQKLLENDPDFPFQSPADN